jgi:hypothetical protein
MMKRAGPSQKIIHEVNPKQNLNEPGKGKETFHTNDLASSQLCRH